VKAELELALLEQCFNNIVPMLYIAFPPMRKKKREKKGVGWGGVRYNSRGFRIYTRFC
jgi:hypothetical protein